MAAVTNIPVALSLEDREFLNQVQQAAGQAQGYLNSISFRPSFKLPKDFSEINNGLGSFKQGMSDLEKSLDAATARVVAFTATTRLFSGMSNAIERLASDAIEVEAAMARISSISNLTGSALKSVENNLYSISNTIGVRFAQAAETYEEFARQGLDVQRSLEGVNTALGLVKLSGGSVEATISGLNAIMNAFENEALNITQVADSLSALDAAFTTTSTGLIDGLSRFSGVAREAGLTSQEAAAALTALKTTTGLAERNLGNSLKSILTALQSSRVQDILENNLGISTRYIEDDTIVFRSQIDVLRDLAVAFRGLSDAQRAATAEAIAGKYQINAFQGLLRSLEGNEGSIFDRALRVQADSEGDIANRLKTVTNTAEAELNRLQNAITQVGSSISESLVRPLVSGFTGLFTPLLESLATEINDDSSIGEAILNGIASVISGPGVVVVGAALIKLFGKTAEFVKKSLSFLDTFTDKGKENRQVQDVVNQALREGNVELRAQVASATTLVQRQAALNNLVANYLVSLRKSAEIANSAPALVGPGIRSEILKNKADGFLPAVRKEKLAIARGVGGASPSAQPALAYVNLGRGKEPVIVNTDEQIIRNFGGTGKDAIITPNMVRGNFASGNLGSGNSNVDLARRLLEEAMEEREMRKDIEKYLVNSVSSSLKTSAGPYQIPAMTFSIGEIDLSAIKDIEFGFERAKAANLQKAQEDLTKAMQNAAIEADIQARILKRGALALEEQERERKLNIQAERKARAYARSQERLNEIIGDEPRVFNLYDTPPPKPVVPQIQRPDPFINRKAQHALQEAERFRIDQAIKESLKIPEEDLRDAVKNQRKRRMSPLRGIGSALALPFVTGMIGETIGGNAGAIVGGVGEGLSTAALGAQFGPLGAAVGGVVGAFQALTSVSSVLTNNFDEVARNTEKFVASANNQNEIVNSLIGTIQARNTALESGDFNRVSNLDKEIAQLEQRLKVSASDLGNVDEVKSFMRRISGLTGPSDLERQREAFIEGNQRAANLETARANIEQLFKQNYSGWAGIVNLFGGRRGVQGIDMDYFDISGRDISQRDIKIALEQILSSTNIGNSEVLRKIESGDYFAVLTQQQKELIQRLYQIGESGQVIKVVESYLPDILNELKKDYDAQRQQNDLRRREEERQRELSNKVVENTQTLAEKISEIFDGTEAFRSQRFAREQLNIANTRLRGLNLRDDARVGAERELARQNILLSTQEQTAAEQRRYLDKLNELVKKADGTDLRASLQGLIDQYTSGALRYEEFVEATGRIVKRDSEAGKQLEKAKREYAASLAKITIEQESQMRETMAQFDEEMKKVTRERLRSLFGGLDSDPTESIQRILEGVQENRSVERTRFGLQSDPNQRGIASLISKNDTNALFDAFLDQAKQRFESAGKEIAAYREAERMGLPVPGVDIPGSVNRRISSQFEIVAFTQLRDLIKRATETPAGALKDINQRVYEGLDPVSIRRMQVALEARDLTTLEKEIKEIAPSLRQEFEKFLNDQRTLSESTTQAISQGISEILKDEFIGPTDDPNRESQDTRDRQIAELVETLKNNNQQMKAEISSSFNITVDIQQEMANSPELKSAIEQAVADYYRRIEKERTGREPALAPTR